MQLLLPEEQQLLGDAFERMLAAESTPARVRAAEPVGFDAPLWDSLASLGAIGMRVATEQGGGGASLFDACLLIERAGRHLASAPLIEAMIAARLLDMVGDEENVRTARWLERLLKGDAVITFVPSVVRNDMATVVPGGAVADAAIAWDGERLLLWESRRHAPAPNLGDAPYAIWSADDVTAILLADGDAGLQLFQQGREEWRLLTAASLVGLSRRALELAAAYAREREQFGRPIGSFQGIAHPLAEAGAHVEGAGLLVWRAISAIAKRLPDAAALPPMAFWAAADASSVAVARALHTFGGYGLSAEYDIQLYHRRAKSIALAAGDPADMLIDVADRLWVTPDAPQALPSTGAIPIDLDPPAEAAEILERARKFFAEAITPELRAHAHHSWEGHHSEMQRKLAEAGLLFPDWPREHGGQGHSPYVISALARAFHEAGWTRHAISVTDMVGRTLMAFGGSRIRSEILPQIARGDAICSFGFTEPQAGSDVFAAQTRATPDGDGWRINGQKMFTSGADIADYVLLLTRTDASATKHRGLTLFLVPLNAPGVEVQAVHTISDERTNITYYSDVFIDDALRIGPVDGGATVLSSALALEHADSGYPNQQRRLVENAVSWARANAGGNGRALDDARVKERLARAAAHAEVADMLGRRSLWVAAEAVDERWIGPMSKLYSTETYIADATALLDLAAPWSLLREQGPVSAIELDYRVSTATSIYGGSSEIMRSIIAEAYLNLPRTRT